jgi:ankyrin repeat protein
MKKNYSLIIAVILFHTQNLVADDYKWDLVNALVINNFEKIEEILNNNIKEMSISEKRLVYNFVLTYTTGENTIKALKILLQHNIHAVPFDLYNAVNKSQPDEVLQFIMEDGTNPNGEILLLASEKKRFNFMKTLIERGVDVNYKYPSEKTYADGMTALLYASQWENFEIVKLLVEHGANVNARANNGSTPLSISYERGRMDICNYLKERGAVDNINNPIPQSNGGISNILNNEMLLRSGTYRLSGGNNEIKIIGDTRSGSIAYTKQGKTGNGMFRIEENLMTVIMEGLTFIYQIESNSSFSGNGEMWIRTGN